MKTDIKDVESYKKHVTVQVPPEEVQPYLDKSYRKYQKKIKIDGFRKGKAPLSLIKKRYGQAIQADVTDELVQQFYTQVLNDEAISPVAPGKIIDVKYQEGDALEFTAELECEPEITVKDYKGIKVNKEIVPVTDDDIEAMLKYLQEQNAGREPVEDGAVSGSLVEADIQALDSTGYPVVGQKWDKRIIELGVPPFGKDVEEQLIGVKAGEERRIRIAVPDAGKKEQDNQDQHYALHVHQIYKKVIPNIDDEFAKSLGAYESVEQLKEQLRTNLQAQRESDSEKVVRQSLSQEIVKRNDYTLPPAQIEFTLENMYEDEKKRTQSEISKDQFLQQHRPMVVWSIKWDRIWHKIAEVESIVISDEAVEEEINRMAQSSPDQEKKIRAQFKSDRAKNRIREHLLEEGVFELLKSEAKIKEVTVKPDKKKKSSIIT